MMMMDDDDDDGTKEDTSSNRDNDNNINKRTQLAMNIPWDCIVRVQDKIARPPIDSYDQTSIARTPQIKKGYFGPTHAETEQSCRAHMFRHLQRSCNAILFYILFI
jgi:hypothetical protein